MKVRNERGFTLVEIIVVMAVLTVFAAVAIPNYFNYRNRSSVKIDVSTCAEIVRAARIYTIIHVDKIATIRDLLADGYFTDEENPDEIIPLTSANAFQLNYDYFTGLYSASFTTDPNIVGRYGGKSYTITENESLPEIK